MKFILLIFLLGAFHVQAEDIDVFEASQARSLGLTLNQYRIVRESTGFYRGKRIHERPSVIDDRYRFPRDITFDLGDGWVQVPRGTKGFMYKPFREIPAENLSHLWENSELAEVKTPGENKVGRRLKREFGFLTRNGNVAIVNPGQIVEILIPSPAMCKVIVGGRLAQ